MRLYNATKKRDIASCKVVNPIIGLMFQRPHPVIFSFRLPQRVSLHNLFVFGTTDVLFVNKKEVVEIKRNFYPFTFYSAKEECTHVVELPAGLDKRTAVGDRIRY